jgi:CSLREA domain-containing protein
MNIARGLFTVRTLRRAMATALFAFAASAQAADLTVTTLADEQTANGACSLREAMIAADSDADFNDCVGAGAYGADTITFGTAAAGGTVALGSTLPIIRSAAGLTIDGGTAQVTVSGGASVRVFEVRGGALSLRRIKVADGAANSFADFSGPFGGGLLAIAATIEVNDSTFLRNFARTGGGAILADGGRIALSNSTFSDNRAIIYGGALALVGASISASVVNSTFVANQADIPGGVGGAMWLGNGPAASIVNSTFFGNKAAAGGAFFGTGTTMRNTLLAGSLAGGNCLLGPIVDGGGNLDDDASCGFTAPTSKSNTPAGLDPAGLKDNGGSTQTVALCFGVNMPAGCTGPSAALDAAVNATCAAAPANNLDQRGASRPQDGDNDAAPVCDIGAFEVAAPGARICSALGDSRPPWWLDQDVFRFSGTKGEDVTLALEEMPGPQNRGKRAALTLFAAIPKVLFARVDASELPNDIGAKLPATGRYYVDVSELPKAFADRFTGTYCIGLRSSMNASSSFEATPTVESVMP